MERTQALIDKTLSRKIHGVVPTGMVKLADISDDVPKVVVNLVNEAKRDTQRVASFTDQ